MTYNTEIMKFGAIFMDYSNEIDCPEFSCTYTFPSVTYNKLGQITLNVERYASNIYLTFHNLDLLELTASG